MGHRIESLNIDLLNALPLPSRNPQDLWCLRQGESLSWNLVLIDMENPDRLEERLSSMAEIPMIRMERSGYGAGETAVFDVLGDRPEVTVLDDKGTPLNIRSEPINGTGGAVRISCPLAETGLYTVKVTDGDKQAEGVLTVHAPWRWIMERARDGAWKYSQKATSHIESWYGFHSAFLAARYFPDRELALAERETASGDNVTDSLWATAAERHYISAKRAVDQLVASQGDFETEGEMTFEDGMISCSALQIGMLALLQEDSTAREHYTEAMLDILHSHDCLAQLRVPDARRRGGTMHYWEAQYDVQMLPNMFNSPHGWSGWRAYATYYAYLLTGEERWLTETLNAACAFSNLIDYRTGDLRWAFVVDPYLRVTQACSADSHVTADSLSFGNPHPELYDTRSFIIGEQYVNMISDWQTVNTQDNDVHEVFKFIGEAMLTNAFIIERPDGTVKGYNCTVTRQGDTLHVSPAEKQITSLHCNLSSPLTVRFPGHTPTDLSGGFLGWL